MPAPSFYIKARLETSDGSISFFLDCNQSGNVSFNEGLGVDMKKAFQLLLFLVFAFVLVSCNGETEGNIRVLVPSFMQSTSTSKGLTQLADSSQDSPFDDAGVAAGVMSTMPILSELTPHDVKSNNAEKEIEKAIGSVIYPFGFKVMPKKILLNEDGLYCYFNIYEEDRWCGYFDYYYNSDSHCFSYREFVVVTTKMPLNGDVPEYSVILFDYKDIPVEKWNTDKPSFRIGQLDESGEFEKNGIMISICHNSGSDAFNPHISFEANYPIMKSDKGVVASIFRPDECRILEYNLDDIDKDQDNLLKAFSDSVKEKLSKSGKKEELNMEESLEILSDSGFFSDFAEMKQHISKDNPSGYTSYEDYISTSYGKGLVEDLSPLYSNDSGRYDGWLVHDNASVYNLNNKKSASDQFAFKMMYHRGNCPYGGVEGGCAYCKNHWNPKHNGRPTIILCTDDAAEIDLIKGCSGCSAPYELFKQFYTISNHNQPKDYSGVSEEAKKESILDYQYLLAEKHLEACGLEPEMARNYARNLVFSENSIQTDFPKHGNHYIKITAEDPETFANKFIETFSEK